MLGGLFSATMLISVFNLHARLVARSLCRRSSGRSSSRWPPAASSMPRSSASPTARCAAGAATRAADHRDRRCRSSSRTSRSAGKAPAIPLCRTCSRPGTSSRSRHHVHVGEADRRRHHRAGAVAPRLARAADAPGQGDACDRSGPRRRGDDGHRRQQDDLVHVPHRRRARRRGRPRVRALLRRGRFGTTPASRSG